MTTHPHDDRTYSVNELADEAGVTRRTVHYYIAQGLLPSSGSEGRGTRYGQGHLDRLLLIRELQREHLPLAEIRQRLERLSDEQIADLRAAGALVPEPPGTAFDYIQSVLAGTSRRALKPWQPQPSIAVPAGPPPPALRGSTPAAARPAPAPPPAPAAPAPAALAGTARPAQEIARLAEAPAAYAPAPQAPAVTAPPDTVTGALIRSQWERISLAPDVELHVRRPLSRIQNRAVDRLVALARQLLEEDPS